jgi:hypothetical protein
MLPGHVNDIWYNNAGMQALLEIEKELTWKKRVVGLRDIGSGYVVRLCCGLHSNANAKH